MLIVYSFLGPSTLARVPERDSRGPTWKDITKGLVITKGHKVLCNFHHVCLELWFNQPWTILNAFIFSPRNILSTNLTIMDSIVFSIILRIFHLMYRYCSRSPLERLRGFQNHGRNIGPIIAKGHRAHCIFHQVLWSSD